MLKILIPSLAPYTWVFLHCVLQQHLLGKKSDSHKAYTAFTLEYDAAIQRM